MRGFSIGAAIMAGFQLIGREPMAFLAWALMYAVIGLGPQFIGIGMGFDAMSSLRGSSSPATMMAAMAPLQRFQPLSFVSSVLAALLLYSAVYRAALFPEDRRFLYLRLSGRELWLAITTVVLVVAYFICLLVAAIPFALILGFGAVLAGAGSGGGSAVAALLAVPLILVAVGAVIWAGLRVSLALPMSFDQRNFRVPEAWRLTREHTGGIFVVFLALAAMMLAAEGVLLGVGAGLVSLFIPLGDLSKAFTTNPAQLFSSVSPVAWVVIAAVWALFGTWSATMFAAALGEIYRRVSGPDAAGVFD